MWILEIPSHSCPASTFILQDIFPTPEIVKFFVTVMELQHFFLPFPSSKPSHNPTPFFFKFMSSIFTNFYCMHICMLIYTSKYCPLSLYNVICMFVFWLTTWQWTVICAHLWGRPPLLHTAFPVCLFQKRRVERF